MMKNSTARRLFYPADHFAGQKSLCCVFLLFLNFLQAQMFVAEGTELHIGQGTAVVDHSSESHSFSKANKQIYIYEGTTIYDCTQTPAKKVVTKLKTQKRDKSKQPASKILKPKVFPSKTADKEKRQAPEGVYTDASQKSSILLSALRQASSACIAAGNYFPKISVKKEFIWMLYCWVTIKKTASHYSVPGKLSSRIRCFFTKPPPDC
jgi:hypothetical protein